MYLYFVTLSPKSPYKISFIFYLNSNYDVIDVVTNIILSQIKAHYRFLYLMKIFCQFLRVMASKSEFFKNILKALDRHPVINQLPGRIV